MKKTLLICLFAGLIFNLSAQKKKVAYCTFVKTMDATATTVENDPIIQVLKADANFDVTVIVVATATDVIPGLDTYDLIVVQEGFGSGATILKTSGSLSLSAMPKPLIYNKTYAFRNNLAVGASTATAADIAQLAISVSAGAVNNDLFKACTINSNNEITVFVTGTNDFGAAGTKSLNLARGNVMSNSNTLLAQPVTTTDATISINDIPAGTVIDNTTMNSRLITFNMNFGAICANAGKNITDDGLTMWRNAAYILTGLPVPSTKATLPTSVINPGDNGRVVAVEYFTINGVSVREPQKGIYVKKTTFDNGFVKNDKVVFVEEYSR
jgi:hypothetical protein